MYDNVDVVLVFLFLVALFVIVILDLIEDLNMSGSVLWNLLNELNNVLYHDPLVE